MHDLVELLDARNRAVTARDHARAVEARGQSLVQDPVDEGGLSGSRHTRDGRKHAEREGHVNCLQVVLASALDGHDALLVDGTARGRQRDAALARQVLAGQRLAVLQQLGQGAGVDDPAARLPRARSDVDDPVRGLHGFLVVLDDDERVAQVPQALKRRNQLAVVALVQADRGLVEHVEHADEARADLGGQADALRLAARERPGAAREGQVGQPHVDQEGQARLDLRQDRRGDGTGTLLQLDLGEEGASLRDGHVGELGDRLVADTHGQDLGAQARTVARRAGNLTHVGVELLRDGRGLGFLALTLDVLDSALKSRRVGALATPAVAELDRDLVVLAVEDSVLDLLRQGLPRGAHREAQFLGEGLEELLVVLEVRVPGNDRAVGEGDFLVGDDQLGVDLEAEAEARAIRAGAVGCVEGEGARLDLVEHERVVVGARTLLGKAAATLRIVGIQVDAVDDDEAIRQAQGGLDGIGQTLAHALANDEAVDDDLDCVLELLLQLGGVLEADHLIVDDRARVALRAQLVDEVLVLALTAAHDRGEHLKSCALIHGAYTVDDLLGGLGLDAGATLGAVRHTRTGVEQTQVVVDLRDRADGRARVARGRLLIDGDGGRQAFDEVHVGLVHLSEELARIRGQ